MLLIYFIWQIVKVFKDKVIDKQYVSKLLKFLKTAHDKFEKILQEELVEKENEDLCLHIQDVKSRIYNNSKRIKSKYSQKEEFFENITE